MPQSERLRSFLICLALAVGTAAVYAPVAHFDFVNYDDLDYVLRNYNVNRGLSWESFRWAFQIGYASNWHPLTWLSHMVDCQLFGLQPGPPHLVNAALHLANSILLFLLLQAMTGRAWRSALVAALFAWHPLHVESVAWISERKDTLSALFFLLTLWAYFRYAEERKKPRPKWKGLYCLTLALFALGLMAKPMLVTLPFILLLLDAWPLGRFDAGFPGGKDQGWRARAGTLALEKLPFFALSAASCALTVVAQRRGGAVRSLTQMPMDDRLLNALAAYGRYVEKLVWPTGLSVIYPFDHRVGPGAAIVGAALAVGVGAVGIAMWKRRPYWLVGWLWFLGSLVPVIGIAQVGDQAMADRYSYLPSIGFFVMICWGAFDLVEMAPRWRPVAMAAAAAALAACLFLTAKQVQTWRDGGALHRQAVAVFPDNYIAHTGYAAYLINIRNLPEARTEAETALRIAPNDPEAEVCLGVVLYLTGDSAGAAERLKRAEELGVQDTSAHRWFGEILLALKKPQEAETELRAQLALDPAEPRAHCDLGQALLMEGKREEAILEFQKSIQIAPDYADAHFNLGRALSMEGKPAEAVQEYRLALRFNPELVEACNNAAWVLATDPDEKVRDGTVAVTMAEKACALTGHRLPQLLGTLAAAYAEAGRYDEAVATAQQAHDLAVAQTNAAVAARNLELEQEYREHRPHREGR